MVILVRCGFSWDHVRRLSELFIPSRVNDASSVNRMTFNVQGAPLSSDTNSGVDQGLLVRYVEPSDRGKGVYHPHVEFATPAYATHRSK
jgi:hypothetical protein